MTPGLAKAAQLKVVPYKKAMLLAPLPEMPSICLSEMVYEEIGMIWRKKKNQLLCQNQPLKIGKE